MKEKIGKSCDNCQLCRIITGENHEDVKARLDRIVLYALEGKKDAGEELERLESTGLLSHSRVIRALNGNPVHQIDSLMAVRALVVPAQKIPSFAIFPSDNILRISGVNIFLSSMNSEECRELIIQTQSLVSPWEEYYTGIGIDPWKQTLLLTQKGLGINPQFAIGIKEYIAGNVTLNTELESLVLSNGGRWVNEPSKPLAKLLEGLNE